MSTTDPPPRSASHAVTTTGPHYQAFKAEVVARLPEHGAVIQRTAALAWLVGRTEAITQHAA